MAERILKIKIENTWGYKFEQMRYIEIIQYQDGSYFSKYTFSNSPTTKQTIKEPMLKSDVEKILSSLSALHIPAFPMHFMGCDGGFTELEVGGYTGKSCYRWWSGPPKGWEEMDKITRGIIKLITGEDDCEDDCDADTEF